MGGKVLKDRMDKDLERMDQIKYSVVEWSGKISIVPLGTGVKAA